MTTSSQTGSFTHRPYLLSIVLAAAMAVSTVAGTLIGVLGPYLRDEVDGVTASNLGILVAAFAVVSGTMAWPAGVFADSIGGRRSLILVFVGSVVGLGFLAAATSYFWLVGAMLVAGLANSAVNPATNRVIATSVAAGDRGLVAGIKMAGVQLAVFAAGVLIPPAAEAFGWRLPLGLAGAAIAGLGILGAVALLRTEPSRGRKAGLKPGFHWSPGLLVLTVYSLLMSGGASSAVTYLSLFTVEDLGSTPRIGGLAVALIGLLAIGGRLALGRATERLDKPMRSLGVVGAVALGSVALVAISDSASSPLFWLGVAGLGLSALSFIAGTTVAVILSTPTEKIGGASGTMFVGFMIGFGGGPAAFGAILEISGSYLAGWVFVAVLFAAATLTSWMALRAGALDTVSGSPA